MYLKDLFMNLILSIGLTRTLSSLTVEDGSAPVFT